MSTTYQAIWATCLILPAMTTAGCGLFGMAPATDEASAGAEVPVLAELGIAIPAGPHGQSGGPGPSLIAGDGIAWAWGRAHGAVSE